MTKAQTLVAQHKHAPLGAYVGAALRVIELLMMFCSLTSAQLGARADWMEAAAAAAGCPGGVPERALAEGEAPDETCAGDRAVPAA
jgi:hypothetical protein